LYNEWEKSIFWLKKITTGPNHFLIKKRKQYINNYFKRTRSNWYVNLQVCF
jgi:hypothetical protein